MRISSSRRPAPRGEQLNLVPLVDILTSIVFFSLATYAGATGLLTAFDLTVPPAASTPDGGARARAAAPRTTVRVDASGFIIELPGVAEAVRISGVDAPALARLRSSLGNEHTGTARSGVTVIAADDVSYDVLVSVLDALRSAGEADIALGTPRRVAG